MKRKSSNLLIVLLCLLVVFLIALAVFMTWFTGEQTAFFEKSIQNIQGTYSGKIDASGSDHMADASDNQKAATAHSFIFVGDSRTVGMEEAMQTSDPTDSCIYIGKVGEGYHWLVNDGIDQLRSTLAEEPDAAVIFNLGVNDLGEIDRYLAFYPEIFAEYPEVSFYIMSVNPVGDACSGASNEEIENFNAKLKETFPDQYLDCYHYLEETGFSTVDELHYTDDTYRLIHDYVVNTLSSAN